VHESVNLLMSSTGQVLRNDVTGKVMMRTFLSGMPECKFGLNDKLIMEKEALEKGGGRPAAGAHGKRSVELDDCTFHRYNGCTTATQRSLFLHRLQCVSCSDQHTVQRH
jgi:Adaptor complexes medium subunit family